MFVKFNHDLQKLCEWLRCNTLSLNISKTHYLIFSSNKQTAGYLDIKISNAAAERDYDTMPNWRGKDILIIRAINYLNMLAFF